MQVQAARSAGTALSSLRGFQLAHDLSDELCRGDRFGKRSPACGASNCATALFDRRGLIGNAAVGLR
jgi:hypothetical protein